MTYLDSRDHLHALLHEEHLDDVVYVYRIGPDEKPVTPYLLKRAVWPGLMGHLQAEYGGGTFRFMIRRRGKMVLTGNFAIAPPPQHPV